MKWSAARVAISMLQGMKELVGAERIQQAYQGKGDSYLLIWCQSTHAVHGKQLM